MQSIVYCLVVVFGILSVCLNSAFTQEIPAPTLTPGLTPPPTSTPTPTTQVPIVTTGEATTNDELYSLTLNGTVNANGLPTTVWFEYGEKRFIYKYLIYANRRWDE